MNTPSNLKYTKTHEWIKVENDIAIEGITDFAQSELSDIAFVELPEKGRIVKQGDSIGTIEAVKAVSDLIAAMSGEIIEVNEILKTSPDKINLNTFDEGWIVKIKISDESEIKNLMNADEYTKYCETNHH
ncbi:MAG: glycine cleavage system protein H [bacterium (Candidatus Stahlbacteria) CG23_combo_of_CG06-09_8_20_14_all_34_7]|nr:MAG: glycine cleavage system protein H [bacterium (Candidatus Stahlbacteria) CG23_combo_of_CG06-09_8_20_14_all_34_7]